MRRDQGFALAFVVFVLFTIGILGSVGYTVVAVEADMALQNDDLQEASSVARAGLARYLGEHLGIPEDTTSYAIGNGTAKVFARYLGEADATNEIDLYLVESWGTVTDARFPNSPATRKVVQYAYLHREPIARNAAAQLSYSSVSIQYYGYFDGNDISSSRTTCAETGEDVYGIAHRGSVSTFDPWGGYVNITGDPGGSSNVYGSHTVAYDSVGLRWDVLTDGDFPVEYDQTWPSFTWTDWPVIRTADNFTATSSHSGQGVLIVPGRLTISSGFYWEGIVLAGEIADTSWQWFGIYGMLIAGMNGTDSSVLLRGLPVVYYDVCEAIGASNALAYFEPIDGSWWEEG